MNRVSKGVGGNEAELGVLNVISVVSEAVLCKALFFFHVQAQTLPLDVEDFRLALAWFILYNLQTFMMFADLWFVSLRV